MSAPAPSAAGDGSATAGGRRVRRSMYFAFVLLAALAVLLALHAGHEERVRAVDADIVQLAASQRAHAEHLGRLAAHDARAPVLREALDRAREESQLLEALLASQRKLEGRSGTDDTLGAWRAARDTLWRHTAAGDGPALQTAADAAAARAAELAERLQRVAKERSAAQLRLLQAGTLLALLVLGLLGLFVVEPTARAVAAHVRRLHDQARELERLALVAARTDNMVCVADARQRIEWINDAFARRSGFSVDEARGRRPDELLCRPDDNGDTLQQVRAALARGQGVRAEFLNRAKDGSEFWTDADIQPLAADAQGRPRGWVVVASDVTERRRLQEQLRSMASTDGLTGLPNRPSVVQRIERALAHGRRHPGYGFAVLFMDFDRFKQINDTLGHAAGDELLREVAQRIVATLRPGDAVARLEPEQPTAARIGGDEFVVVLEGVRGADDARTVAERLLQALSEPYVLAHQPVQSSASIGLVYCDGQSAPASADEVLRDADTAMYEAKRAGRGRCVVFDSSMHERLRLALEMETDLRRALRERELFPVFQPVLDLEDGSLVAVEALVRWRHPQHGIVLPGRFIGVAEEAGLIDTIGRQVLEGGCRQFAAWRQRLGARAPRLLAVNLSRAQLQQGTLVGEVAAVLAAHGMQPPELELEITESLAAQDETVQATLRELQKMGVRLALDDFGTGYSSLACLHQLPVDTVKIDRSFVAHAEVVEYHRVLIEATIRVAQTLGMTTVAEGIETEGQARLMRQLRCNRGQGYLFSRPLQADELERWLLADRRPVAAAVID